MENAKDIYMHLQQVGMWLDRYRSNNRMLRQVIGYLSGLCLQQFRADVFRHLMRDGALKESCVKEATSGLLQLCYKTMLDNLLDGEPWLVGGNKSDIKDPETLINYLFDWEPFIAHRGLQSKEKRRLH